MFGVAARRKAVTPELFAINRITRSLPDAVKSRPGSRFIEPGGPAFRRSRAEVPALVRAVRVAAVPAKLSRYAGRYVCNFALWHGLAAMPRETRVVFIHIPMPRKAGEVRGTGKPDIAALIRAGKAIARAILR
jgi:pyroglutamyl-peptidase